MIEPDGSPKVSGQERHSPARSSFPPSDSPDTALVEHDGHPASAPGGLGVESGDESLVDDPTTDFGNGHPTSGLHAPDLHAAAPALCARIGRLRSADPVYPRDPAEAVERILRVREAYASGDLHEEADRLGVSAEWFDGHFQQPVRVALTEQLMPLTTLFAKLGGFGSPGAMARAFGSMLDLQRRLMDADSGIEEVRIGQLASLDHSATFKDISGGFHVYVPLMAAGSEGERIEGRHFFSNKDEKRFKGTGYRDLTIAVAKLDTLAAEIHRHLELASTESKKNISAAERQLKHNDSLRERGLPVTSAQAARVELGFTVGARYLDRASAANAFFEDLQGAMADAGVREGARPERVNYCTFVAALNARLAQRFFPGMEFETAYGEHLNTLPSFGIRDWTTFINRFSEAGIFQPGDPLLRLRVETGRDIDYRVLAVAEMNRFEIILVDKESGERHRLDHLVEQSRESLLTRDMPTLIPIAMMRYWANYAMSSSVGLDDGMPYEKIGRVHLAMQDPEFAVVPRAMTIFPYTRLSQGFKPRDPSDPYADLKASHDVLDYYHFAQHINQQRGQ